MSSTKIDSLEDKEYWNVIINRHKTSSAIEEELNNSNIKIKLNDISLINEESTMITKDIIESSEI